MAAGRYDIKIEQGSTFVLNLTYKDSNDQPLNLSTYQSRMKIKDSHEGSVIASTESGDAPLNTISIALGSSTNNVVVTITNSATAAFNFDHAVYDIELVSNSGAVERLIEGRVFLSKEVTS